MDGNHLHTLHYIRKVAVLYSQSQDEVVMTKRISTATRRNDWVSGETLWRGFQRGEILPAGLLITIATMLWVYDFQCSCYMGNE